jgi:hypothetical protein
MLFAPPSSNQISPNYLLQPFLSIILIRPSFNLHFRLYLLNPIYPHTPYFSSIRFTFQSILSTTSFSPYSSFFPDTIYVPLHLLLIIFSSNSFFIPPSSNLYSLLSLSSQISHFLHTLHLSSIQFTFFGPGYLQLLSTILYSLFILPTFLPSFTPSSPLIPPFSSSAQSKSPSIPSTSILPPHSSFLFHPPPIFPCLSIPLQSLHPSPFLSAPSHSTSSYPAITRYFRLQYPSFISLFFLPLSLIPVLARSPNLAISST